MTRKDYKLIAEILDASGAPQHVVTAFAIVLGVENKKFCVSKFLEASLPELAETKDFVSVLFTVHRKIKQRSSEVI